MDGYCLQLFGHHGLICVKQTCILSATLTITKHWNCLKGDIVEALQVMKSLLHQELVFCETGPSSTTKNLCEKHDEELLNAELDGLEFWYLM